MTWGGIRPWITVAALAAAVWMVVGATAAAVANDNFANAIALSGPDVSRSNDSNVNTTLESGEDATVAGVPAGASVWYAWTAAANGMVVVDTATSGFDTLLGVYTGTAVNSLAEVASNDDFVTPPGTSRVRFPATNGTVYKIRVDGYEGATGTINLHVHQAAPPANDNFGTPVVLSGTSDSKTGTNDGATLEAGEADTVAGVDGGASVWYRWTAPSDGNVTIDTQSSTFDTLLGVYTGASVDNLDQPEVASNDDVKVPPTSLIRFPAESGKTYQIRVDGFAQATGTIHLHLAEVATPSPPANDAFGSAVSLPNLTSTTQPGTTAGATLQTGEAGMVAGVPAGASVWYSWTAPTSGTVTIDTAGSGFDTMLGVYTGSDVASFACSMQGAACNDDVGKTDLTSKVRFQAIINTVYQIRIDGYAGDSGAFTLHLNENLPPANDDYAHAYLLSGASDNRTNDTNEFATRQTGAGEDVTVAGQSASTSVWYTWTAPQSTTVTIDTATSDFDTLLGVYIGTPFSTWAEVASNNNVSVSDHTSRVSFGVTTGLVYWIRVDGLAGATGTIRLHLALATVSAVATNVIAIPGAGQATLTWTAPFDGGSPITGYEITRYEAGQAPVTTTVSGAVTQATVTGLTNGTTYTFRIAATNVVGTGGLSANSNPVTPRTVPDAPTGVSATGGAGQATVSWTAPAFNGGAAITGYTVKRYVGGVEQGTSNFGAVTQASVGGLTNGTTYTFKVAAKNAAGIGAFSPDSNAVTPRAVPDAPTNLTVTPGPAQVTVGWSVPSANGSAITGYDVTTYLAGVAQGTTSLSAVTQTTVTGLTNGTAYTFRVAATNALGTGPQSASSAAVTPRTRPDAPTNLSADAGGAGQATISWNAPASNGGAAITSYEVTSFVSGVAKGKITVGLVSQATFGGLTNGLTYTFRVAATNVAGTGAQSADSNSVAVVVPKFTLNVAKSGSGGGMVSGGAINCGVSCAVDLDTGSSVTLTASAAGGSTFAGWSGPCTGIGTCTVWIDAAKTVTAKFDQVPTQQQTQSTKCVVPNLKGKTVAAAKRLIKRAHCRTGKLTQANSPKVAKGRVITQKPGARKKLAAGAKVNLVVSRGKR